VAVEADVPDGGLIAFADDSRLSCLEYWTTADETPAEQIRVAGPEDLPGPGSPAGCS